MKHNATFLLFEQFHSLWVFKVTVASLTSKSVGFNIINSFYKHQLHLVILWNIYF